MTRRYYFLNFVFIFFIFNSCYSNIEELASLSSPGNQAEPTSSSVDDTVKLYTITNDFQDRRGNPVHIHLSSVKTKKNYVIPPTTYNEVVLDYVKMDMKVEGECLKIPSEAFPVSVSVCKLSDCVSVRSLDVLLKNPAHYNISGIGGLLIPQIYPVSPCSDNFIKLIGTVSEYKKL